MKDCLRFRKILFLGAIALFFIFPFFLRAQENISLLPSGGTAEIYIFYSKTCSFCQQARTFLNVLKQKYSGLVVKEFDVAVEQNRNLWVVMAGLYGEEAAGVPAIFIGEEMLEGFGENMKASFEAKVRNCLQNGCISPIKKIQGSLSANAQKADRSQSGADFTTMVWGVMILFFGPAVLAALMIFAVFKVIKIIKKKKAKGGQDILP